MAHEAQIDYFIYVFVCVCVVREREWCTRARMQAVTPVPHEVTTGLSKEMPAVADEDH